MFATLTVKYCSARTSMLVWFVGNSQNVKLYLDLSSSSKVDTLGYLLLSKIAVKNQNGCSHIVNKQLSPIIIQWTTHRMKTHASKKRLALSKSLVLSDSFIVYIKKIWIGRKKTDTLRPWLHLCWRKENQKLT